MLKAPCKECTDRYLACHDHCEKYREYDAERKKIQELASKQKQTNYDYYRIRKHHVRKDKYK